LLLSFPHAYGCRFKTIFTLSRPLTAPAQPNPPRVLIRFSIARNSDAGSRQQAAPPRYNLQTLTGLMDARNCAYITGNESLTISCQNEFRRIV